VLKHLCNKATRHWQLSFYKFAAGHFTSRISLSLSAKFGLKPQIKIRTETTDQPSSEVIFFVWTRRFAEHLVETKLRTERSLNSKLINSPVDFAYVNRLAIEF